MAGWVQRQREEDEMYLPTSGGGMGFADNQYCQADLMAELTTSDNVFVDDFISGAADTTNIYTPFLDATTQPMLPCPDISFDTLNSSGGVPAL